MSDLRLFADTMHELIARQRRLDQISANATRYADHCEAIRAANLPTTDRPARDFHQASEGISAVRIILGESERQ